MDENKKDEREEFFGNGPEREPRELREPSVGVPPAPKRAKKANGWRFAGYCLGALLVAGMGFLGGYYTYAGALDKEMRSLIWAKKQIQEHYYQEITDEDFYNAVFDGVNGLLDSYSGYLTPDE